MGNLINSFKIKVVIDEYDYIYISIRPNNTIKEVKDIINQNQGKINPEYVQVYKGNELLDEKRTIGSYNVTSFNALLIKSSRKNEFLVFFWTKSKTVGKYVTKDDKIFDAFNLVKFKFKKDLERTDGAFLFCGCIEIRDNSIFEDINIVGNSKIIVRPRYLFG